MANFQLRAPEPNAKYGGTLRYCILSAPAHFDVHQSGTVANMSAQGPMYDNLICASSPPNILGRCRQGKRIAQATREERQGFGVPGIGFMAWLGWRGTYEDSAEARGEEIFYNGHYRQVLSTLVTQLPAEAASQPR